HPLTSERMADMQSRQPLGKPGAASAAATLEHAMIAARARVLSNPGVDALRALLAEAEGAKLASMAAPRQAGALYGAALAASRLRDFPRAKLYLERLMALVPADAWALRLSRWLEAEIALSAGDAPRAAAVLNASPGGRNEGGADAAGPRRPELFLAVQLALQTGQGAAAGEAAQRLQSWVAAHPRDAQAWQLLSSAYAAQGQSLRAIRASAETQVALLDYPAAVDRFRAAQELLRQGRAGNAAADHIEASIIDTRKRQVELLLKEQTLDR
ncbi:MAG: peptidase M48, partial [Rhodoferax sp.]